MIPDYLHPLFWDTNLESFVPESVPGYTISRILEFGDREAIAWMKTTFSEDQIVQVLRTERRLSRPSANFWALVFHVDSEQVAALRLAS